MSKSIKRKPEETRIHRVGREKPEKVIDQELKRINTFGDLENIDLDEVLENLYTTQIKH